VLDVDDIIHDRPVYLALDVCEQDSYDRNICMKDLVGSMLPEMRRASSR
jgi:hypothetical protein